MVSGWDLLRTSTVHHKGLPIYVLDLPARRPALTTQLATTALLASQAREEVQNIGVGSSGCRHPPRAAPQPAQAKNAFARLVSILVHATRSTEISPGVTLDGHISLQALEGGTGRTTAGGPELCSRRGKSALWTFSSSSAKCRFARQRALRREERKEKTWSSEAVGECWRYRSAAAEYRCKKKKTDRYSRRNKC